MKAPDDGDENVASCHILNMNNDECPAKQLTIFSLGLFLLGPLGVASHHDVISVYTIICPFNEDYGNGA